MEEMNRIVVTMRKRDSDSMPAKLKNPHIPENRIGSRVLELIKTNSEKDLPDNVEPLPVEYKDGSNPPDIPA